MGCNASSANKNRAAKSNIREIKDSSIYKKNPSITKKPNVPQKLPEVWNNVSPLNTPFPQGDQNMDNFINTQEIKNESIKSPGDELFHE